MLDLSGLDTSGGASTAGAGSCGLLVSSNGRDPTPFPRPGLSGPRFGLTSWLFLRDREEARVDEVESRGGTRAGEGSREGVAVDAGVVGPADDTLCSGDLAEDVFLLSEVDRRGSIMPPSPPVPTRRAAVDTTPRLLPAALD